MQVVLVSIQPFHRNLVVIVVISEMCAASKNCEKFTKNPLLGGSWSFKVMTVDKSKKPVTSACYDKHHVCIYLQPFSHYASQ